MRARLPADDIEIHAKNVSASYIVRNSTAVAPVPFGSGEGTGWHSALADIAQVIQWRGVISMC